MRHLFIFTHCVAFVGGAAAGHLVEKEKTYWRGYEAGYIARYYERKKEGKCAGAS